MKLITLYLFAVLVVLTYALLLILMGKVPTSLDTLKIGLLCAVIGGIGGCVYCLRGIYISACVRKNWDDIWKPWYYIRPIVSIACGGISYLFLRAGLLFLESGTRPESSALGFYALAFIAGLNVDKFISKVEDISQAAWGIEKSRTSSPSPEKQI